MAEAPPHYLKFSSRFIRGIDQAPSSTLRLLGSVVSLANDHLVRTVAVGIHTPAEAQASAKIGFAYGQGDWAGPPIEL